MTDTIPEVGSEWLNKKRGSEYTVVFADYKTVLFENCYGARLKISTETFFNLYKPKPRVKKYQRWINITDYGDIHPVFMSRESAEDSAKYWNKIEGSKVVETRLIEWEVPE